MARRNLIEVSPQASKPDERSQPLDSRPLAGFVTPVARSAPIGGISKSLGALSEQAARASEFEKQLAEGQQIVELEPALIEGSFVKDRLDLDESELKKLADQIKENGQQVPILVRHHPTRKGHYQIAYGHRRLAATKLLSLKVRAVVRDLTDEQLVVSQGQENNARTDLSFIERALFAVGLEDRNFSREIIMAALGVDKAALSKMITVARQLPQPMIALIGAAPDVGRRRWMELASFLDTQSDSDVSTVIAKLDLSGLRSDERFQRVYETFSKRNAPGTKPEVRVWKPADNLVRVTVKQSSKASTISLGAQNAAPFAEWITDNLDGLYADFQRSIESETGD